MKTRRGACGVILSVTVVLWSGCAPQARVEVDQPHAGGRQRHLRLQSSWAAFAENGSTRVLLAFPLPGAQRGDKHYYVYMRCSLPQDEPPMKQGGPAVIEGFFQQVWGRHAGIAPFAQASVQMSGGADSRWGRFEIECEDGTRLQGDFIAKRDDWDVQQFEESFGLE